MEFGITGKLEGNYLAKQYQKSMAAGNRAGVGFAELAAAALNSRAEINRCAAGIGGKDEK